MFRDKNNSDEIKNSSYLCKAKEKKWRLRKRERERERWRARTPSFLRSKHRWCFLLLSWLSYFEGKVNRTTCQSLKVLDSLLLIQKKQTVLTLLLLTDF